MSPKPLLATLFVLIYSASPIHAAEPAPPRWLSSLPPLYRAAVLTWFKEYDDALTAANDAVAATPDNPAALGLRARIQLRCDNFVAAVADSSAAEQLRPDHPELRAIRGKGYAYLKQYAQACADLTVALRQRSNDPKLWETRAVIWERQGNPAAGLADMLEAIRLDPTNPEHLLYPGSRTEGLFQSELSSELVSPSGR